MTDRVPDSYRGGIGNTVARMQTENIVQSGGGSQTGPLHRWGDYSHMSVDPVDDCTFWYTNEYLKSSGSFNWGFGTPDPTTPRRRSKPTIRTRWDQPCSASGRCPTSGR